MAIKDWPASERPREKLLTQGAAQLTDAELLAIFLRTGVAGKSAVVLAQELLHGFGSLAALLKADLASFSQGKGLGSAKYAQLQAVLEMARRHLGEQLRRDNVFTAPEQVRQYLLALLRAEEREIFACLLLDSQHRLIHMEPLFMGTIDAASVYPREVVKLALRYNAAAMIVAHNHPSGIAEPSRADELITQRLKQALALVEVRLLDHMVVGAGEVVSLAERGLV
ncbi:RadC family protein [Balneatrix alpica]|uniref:RadC family protein n=1 Tax=Balneatrix alpica TaxID=75684 RepID=UPI0027381DCE|nr:DNA repair protein RadC [Balneatrix alpica]